MDDYYSGRIKAARDREWYGTQESENSDSDSDGSNYESPTVDPFDNAVENENENSHINDGDYDIDYDHDGNPHDTSLLNPHPASF
ncbi:hypothetical protein DVH05_027499 [Phytophthora capsici]|nr:hypothetical protein DVH05_027499 [Phytophthora capsici]